MKFELTPKANSRYITIHGSPAAVIYDIHRLPEHHPGLDSRSAL